MKVSYRGSESSRRRRLVLESSSQIDGTWEEKNWKTLDASLGMINVRPCEKVSTNTLLWAGLVLLLRCQ